MTAASGQWSAEDCHGCAMEAHGNAAGGQTVARGGHRTAAGRPKSAEREEGSATAGEGAAIGIAPKNFSKNFRGYGANEEPPPVQCRANHVIV